LICVVSLCLCVSVVSPATAQDAMPRIKAAQYALGMIRGPQRIDAINTLEYWGTGYAQKAANMVTYHVSLSYLTPAMRVDITQSAPAVRQIEVVNGNFAWNESVPGAGFIPGTTATPAPGSVKDRLLRLWSTPDGALKAAERAGPNAKLTQEKGATVITFPLADTLSGITMKVTLNGKDQVENVETRPDNARLGSTVTETTYSDYKDLSEIQSDVLFPSRIVQKQNGVTVLDVTITKTDTNNPYVVFPVPENVEKARQD
jgi:hypothetical protein